MRNKRGHKRFDLIDIRGRMEQACYEIELTYSDLGGKGKATLKEFIDYLVMWRSEKKEA